MIRCRLRVDTLWKLMSSAIRGRLRLDVVCEVMLHVDISSGGMTWSLVNMRQRVTLYEGEYSVRPFSESSS